MDIEMPEEFAQKMSLVHDEVASDGTFDPPINKWSAMLTARDALLRAECAERAIENVEEQQGKPGSLECKPVEINIEALKAAIMAEPEEAHT